MKLIFILLTLFCMWGICYFADHNRFILMFGIYPLCAVTGIGFLLWAENQ